MGIRDNSTYDTDDIAFGVSLFNPIHYGGKLFQQYLVDAYIRAEQDRLDYHRFHQIELRCENYITLHDYLADTADELGIQVGKTIILPSSFEGSPRNCQQGNFYLLYF